MSEVDRAVDSARRASPLTHRPVADRPPPAALPLWPLTAMFGLVPLWWLLGAFSFGWPLFGALLAALLVTRGRVRLPAGTGCWLVFLAIVGVSATRIDRPTGYLSFTLRLGFLLTAFIVCLYVYNLARDGVAWRRLLRPLCLYWLAIVALGWLGVLAPTFAAASPVEILLPQGLATERFVHDLTHLNATEFNPQSRAPIYRPAAPYPYTNNWGTAYAFGVPCVLAYLTSVRRGALRAVLLLSLPLSVVPAFLTLNRGMFLGLGAGLAYLALRALARGQVRPVLPIVALVLLGWLASLVIPVGALIADRTARTGATSDRMDLLTQTWHQVLRSPLLGYGVPKAVDTTRAAEPLGTHGQLSQVLYSHGIPAMICFLALLYIVSRRLARAVSTTGRWLSTVPVIAAVVVPFYSYTDPNMSVLFFAVGVGLAAVDGPVNREVPTGRARP